MALLLKMRKRTGMRASTYEDYKKQWEFIPLAEDTYVYIISMLFKFFTRNTLVKTSFM